MFTRLVDNRLENSLATKFRKNRFRLFQSLLNTLTNPISILDIGGTEEFWHVMSLLPGSGVNITLINLESQTDSRTGFQHVEGDALSLPFDNQSFDVVFSNSVIEHVGGFDDQKKMAGEIKRVALRYFIQTPNRNFPIEPHFVFPLFQFLPISARAWMLNHYQLGWFPKAKSYQDALKEVQAIRLLNKRELVNLFQGAKIYEETILGLRKSFVAYSGWENIQLYNS